MEGLLGAGGFRARPILPAAAVVPATRAELISVPERDSIMGTPVLGLVGPPPLAVPQSSIPAG